MPPTRMCLGCRERGNKTELIRIAVAQGIVLVDAQQQLPGRGAYLHPSSQCLQVAARKRPWSRALRTEVDAGAAAEAIRRHLDALA